MEKRNIYWNDKFKHINAILNLKNTFFLNSSLWSFSYRLFSWLFIHFLSTMEHKGHLRDIQRHRWPLARLARPQRGLADRNNSYELYSDPEFRSRYRFSKESTSSTCYKKTWKGRLKWVRHSPYWYKWWQLFASMLLVSENDTLYCRMQAFLYWLWWEYWFSKVHVLK